VSSSREDVYAAVFALCDIPLIKTRNRLAKDFDQVTANEQPACFQMELQEIPETSRGVPDIFRLGLSWIVYTDSGSDPDRIPSTPLNEAVQALLDTLAPPAGRDVNTLGGLVARVYPGQVQYFEAVLGRQAMALIPINLVYVPDFDAGGCP
jgi:hypothetical protein